MKKSHQKKIPDDVEINSSRFIQQRKRRARCVGMLECERKIGFQIEDINVNNYEGKRLRGELLVRLKDLGG